jgi:hypothetical protein
MNSEAIINCQLKKKGNMVFAIRLSALTVNSTADAKALHADS